MNVTGSRKGNAAWRLRIILQWIPEAIAQGRPVAARFAHLAWEKS